MQDSHSCDLGSIPGTLRQTSALVKLRLHYTTFTPILVPIPSLPGSVLVGSSLQILGQSQLTVGQRIESCVKSSDFLAF